MELSDTEILDLIRRDTEAGFSLLVKVYSERIYWHVRRLVISFEDADDIVQEVFLRIFKSLPTFRGQCSLSSWIYRIATNDSLRFIEQRKKRGILVEYGKDDFDTYTDEYIDFSDKVIVEFQRAIHSLPTKQQVAFTLRYYDELSYEEIAQILDTSATSAKASYHQAKNKLKDYLINKAIDG